MSRPVRRSNSTVIQFRKMLPRDLRGKATGTRVAVRFPAMSNDPEHVATATIGTAEVGFSLRTRDPLVAKMRQAIANQHVEAILASLRQGPEVLTHKQAVALAGEVYRAFIAEHSENPATPEDWAAVKGFNRAVREGRRIGHAVPALHIGNVTHHKAVANAAFGADLTAGIDALERSPTPQLEDRFGALADYVLAAHHLVVDAESRGRLLVQIDAASTDAAKALKANAAGDYTPDVKAGRFPPVEAIKPATAKGPTWKAVIGAWARRHEQGDGSASTRRDWCRLMNRFAEYVKASPAEVTASHVRSWLASRTNDNGVSARTITVRDVATIKAVFAAAIGAGLFKDGHVNPTSSVQAPKQSAVLRKKREMRSYSDDEVTLILAAAESEHDPLRRWVPQLCATTGSRVATMVNLRGCDVKKIQGIWCLTVDPEAGPVKTAPSIRDVPLHPDVIASGFLEFVKAKGDGRLFYDDTERRRMRYRQVPGQKLAKARHRRGSEAPATSRGDNAAKRLAKWIKSIPGLAVGMAVRKAPCHAFRKWTSTKLAIANVDDAVQKAVTGHAAADVAGQYPDRHLLLSAMYEAVAAIKIPSSILTIEPSKS